MMTSSNGNIFRVTGPLCGKFTGHRWIPLTKASDTELRCFLWSVHEQTVEWTIVMPVIWDPSRSLFRHCNATLSIPTILVASVYPHPWCWPALEFSGSSTRRINKSSLNQMNTTNGEKNVCPGQTNQSDELQSKVEFSDFLLCMKYWNTRTSKILWY